MDGVIIVANTPGGPLSGIFDHAEAASNLLGTYYATIGDAHAAAEELGVQVQAILAAIQDLTTAGAGIVPITNIPVGHTYREGINTDGDAFEEFAVTSKTLHGQVRYSIFAGSNGDNQYDRRIDLAPW